MTGMQAAIETVQGMVERGQISRDDANIEVVRIMGVRVVESRIPAQVRAELSRGVKAGRIGRIAKKGLCPEAYFHPNSKHLAMEAVERISRASIESLKAVFVSASDLAKGD